MGRTIQKFLGHVLPGVIRPIHALWNEVIGFLFIVLAVIASSSVFREFRRLDTTSGSPFRLMISLGFAALMAYFGISSFLKARKISRS